MARLPNSIPFPSMHLPVRCPLEASHCQTKQAQCFNPIHMLNHLVQLLMFNKCSPSSRARCITSTTTACTHVTAVATRRLHANIKPENITHVNSRSEHTVWIRNVTSTNEPANANAKLKQPPITPPSNSVTPSTVRHPSLCTLQCSNLRRAITKRQSKERG